MAKLKSVSGTVADPTVRFAELEVGDKKILGTFNLNAYAKAEHITGLPLLSGISFENPTFIQLRGLIYGAMLPAEPNIIPDEAGNVIAEIMAADGCDAFEAMKKAVRWLEEAYGFSKPPKDPTPAA